jgi:hypothetical protein
VPLRSGRDPHPTPADPSRPACLPLHLASDPLRRTSDPLGRAGDPLWSALRSAVGEFEIDYPFILGPAIDEAAAHHESAEAAVVWLAPSARNSWEAHPFMRDHPGPLCAQRIPLKGGSSYETYAVSPFGIDDHEGKRREFKSAMLAAFDRDRAGGDCLRDICASRIP